MSLSIANATLDLALQLVASQAATQRQALAVEVAVLKEAQDSQGAALQLLVATTENLGQLIDVFA